MLFNLDFANSTILSYFFFFLLVIDLYFLHKFFNPIDELAIPIGIPTLEAKAEMETHSVIVEITTSKWPIQFKPLQTFLCFLLTN